jgi:SH3 domain protein
MSVRAVFIVCLLFAIGAQAQAQTRYVTDKLVVELRRGPSTEYLIIRNLEVGEPVEVLEQDTANGYSRVRVLDQGTEGWILTRFLTAEPIARDRLVAAERNLTSARGRVDDLEGQLATLSQQLSTTKTDLDETRATHGEVSKELADIRVAAANVVGIRDENKDLRDRLARSDDQVQRLTRENEALSGQTRQSWFIIGAGVLLGGIVIGLVAPSLRRKRRSEW